MISESVHLKTAVAFVAGAAAVGAGVGLLFSPQSGAETRRELGGYAKKTQSEATRVGRSVRSRMDKAIEYSKSLLPKKENPSDPVAA